MSTKNTQTQQSTFNQPSMDTFNSFQPSFRNNMMDFMNDPLKSSFFNTQYQMAQKQNQASYGAGNSAMMQNLAAGGSVGNVPAYMQSNLLRNQRALSGANSNSFNNLLLGANQLRFGATQNAGSYRPLQTGSTQTQQQSGLGSWLPQVAGAALGIAGGFATGGASSFGKMASTMGHMGQGSMTQSGGGFDNPLLQPTSYNSNPGLSGGGTYN